MILLLTKEENTMEINIEIEQKQKHSSEWPYKDPNTFFKREYLFQFLLCILTSAQFRFSSLPQLSQSTSLLLCVIDFVHHFAL